MSKIACDYVCTIISFSQRHVCILKAHGVGICDGQTQFFILRLISFIRTFHTTTLLKIVMSTVIQITKVALCILPIHVPV